MSNLKVNKRNVVSIAQEKRFFVPPKMVTIIIFLFWETFANYYKLFYFTVQTYEKYFFTLLITLTIARSYSTVVLK